MSRFLRTILGGCLFLYSLALVAQDSTPQAEIEVYFDSLAVELIEADTPRYRIPLRVRNFTNITAYQVSILLEAEAPARVVDYDFATVFSPGEARFNILQDGKELILLDVFQDTESTQTVPDSLPIGYLEVAVDRVCTSFSLDCDGPRLTEFIARNADGSTPTLRHRCVPATSIGILCDSISGSIQTPDGRGLPDHVLTLSVDGRDTQTTTDANGQFVLAAPSLTNGADLSLRSPVVNEDIQAYGLSTIDYLIFYRHMLGLETLSDFEIEQVADFDRDGELSIFDLVAWRRIILGLDPLVDTEGSYFIDEQVQLSPIEVSAGERYDFQFVRRGDINYSGR